MTKAPGGTLSSRWWAIPLALAVAGGAGCASNRYPTTRYTPYSPKPAPAAPARAAVPAPAAAPAPAPAVRPIIAAPAAPAPAARARASAAPATKATPPAASSASDQVYRLKSGDPVIVYLRGIPGVAGGEQQIQLIVNENGGITLPYINDVAAGGKSATELEQSIRKSYLDQQIYKYITVNVVVPSQSYYLRGEVRQPGRFALVGEVTIVQAIAAAGGFTEFANPANVEILRGNERIRVNVRELEIRPDRDKPLQAGDVIIVNRSFL